MSSEDSGELYHNKLIGMLERLWGDGWLSPGGPEEVERLLEGVDLLGKSVLDIGCGAGGVDILLVKAHGAVYVTGIDVEDTVLEHARRRAHAAGLEESMGFVKVAPGLLPFPPATFDVVFSKDAIIHIADKHRLMAEVFRVLKPGGQFIASDWLIGHDHEPSPQMKTYIESEGLDFGMASPKRYREAMEASGFVDISLISRNAWYRQRAREELDLLKGDLRSEASHSLGGDFVDHNIQIWENMLPVLDTGEHCPTHMRAHKPGPP